MKRIRKIPTIPFNSWEEMKETEQEFGVLLTQSWEAIYRKPSVHAKAIRAAKKLRELKTLLLATGQLPQSIH